MKFASRLKISSHISFGLLVVLVPLLVWSSGELKNAGENDVLADDIQTLTFERVTQSDEYFFFAAEGARQQWLASTEQTGQLLQKGATQFAGKQERRVLAQMQTNFKDTVEIFQRLVEQAGRISGAAGRSIHDDDSGKRLYSQIMLKATELQRASGQLQSLTRGRFNRAISRTIAFSCLFVFLVFAVTILNSSLVHRLLRRRLATLREGVASIASGDLDHRIDCRGSDELAELAKVLNVMAERVQDSTKGLQKSHDLLNDLSAQVPGILFQTCLSPEGHFSTPYASRAIADIYQLPPESVTRDATPIFDTFHPDDFDGIFASIQESARTLQPWEHEYRVVLPRHGIKWLRGHARPMRQEDGGTLWHGFVTDVTDRRSIEEALQKSESRFRLQFRELSNIYAHTPAGLFAVDRDLRFLRINERMAEINGRPVEEHLGRTIDELLPADLAANLREIWRPVLEGRESALSIELQGTVWWSPEVARHWLASYHPLLSDAGEVVGLMGSVLDITDRKLAEESARRSEHFLRATIDAISASICVLDEQGTILSVNKRWRDFAVSNPPVPENFGIGLNYLAVCDAALGADREDAVGFAQGIRAVSSGEAESYAKEYPCHSDLVQRWFRGSVTRFTEGGRFWIVIAHEDITQRRFAEHALQKSEERYRAVVEDQTELISRFLPDGTMLFVNDVYCRFFGRSEAALVGNDWHPEAVAEDLPMIEEQLALLSPLNPVVTIENRVYSGSGKVHWMQFVNRGFFDPQGELVEIQGVGRDITVRVDLELKLRESEMKYRTLVMNAPFLVTNVDREGIIHFINRCADGFDAESVVGSSSYRYLAGESKEIYRAALHEVFSSQLPQSIVVQGLGAQSETRWYETVLGPLVADGQVVSAIQVTIDITERKRGEEILAGAKQLLEQQVQERTASLSLANELLTLEIEVRKKVEQEILDHQQKLQTMAFELSMAEERERDRIAGELHDQVGQRLILGKMKLNALTGKLPTGACENAAEEIEALIDQSIQDIRSLTFQIRPPILASAGLEAALRWLGEELRADFGLEVDFCDDGQPKPLRYEVRSTVFQAARELMLNVAKHAGTGHCRVRLERAEGLVVITTEDDGVGFLPRCADAIYTRGGGFGLFNVRQRVEHLGGSFAIAAKAGGGTRATIMVPLETADEVPGGMNYAT